MPTSISNPINGALIIDKPAGMTSHDVVSRIRRVSGERRVGHIGTLDPFATGVLVLLVGKATRLARFYDGAEKSYEAVMRVGFATDTYDSTGTPAGPDRAGEFDAALLEPLLPEFQGAFLQRPPAFSAKKIAGVPAYKKARKGQEVDLAPVPVTIANLTVLEIEGPLVRFSVTVSSGTYIRSLADDIGERLGLGAHLTVLRRITVGSFTLQQATVLDRLDSVAAVGAALIPMEQLLPAIPEKQLTPEELRGILHGRSIPEETRGEWLRLLTPAGQLAAMAKVESPGWYHPEVVLGELVPKAVEREDPAHDDAGTTEETQ